jgi:hypothetical protein
MHAGEQRRLVFRQFQHHLRLGVHVFGQKVQALRQFPDFPHGGERALVAPAGQALQLGQLSAVCSRSAPM